MTTDFLGIALSLLTWGVGLVAHRSLYAAAVGRLPETWRSHPEIGPRYDPERTLGRDDYARWGRQTLPWFVGITAFFAVIVAADVLWEIQLAICVIASVVQTSRARDQQRQRIAKLAADYNLEPLVRRKGWARWWIVATYLLQLGFLAAALFVARLIVQAV
jgi:hypothetical protein